jgi:hypothetical protein
MNSLMDVPALFQPCLMTVEKIVDLMDEKVHLRAWRFQQVSGISDSIYERKAASVLACKGRQFDIVVSSES